ncbi:MAG: polysaccharide deacetylase [Thermomicrobiales bacterium]|nr:polysaccharide deacetylase [Thermomicrobiales bacterium]
MSDNRPTICLSFDFDAISIWVGPYAATSPGLISRGEFGAVGVERILALLERYAVPATFFIPGHTVETYPDHTRAIVAAGHEVGHHGYLHEKPGELSEVEERRVMERGLEAFETVAGVRPTGYRSPSWDNSTHTVDLLLEHGFRYESSLMADDFTPYWCRTGDRHQPDGPFHFGTPIDLVEMPVSWILDDFPHFEFLSVGAKVMPGLSAPSKVEEIWWDEFTFMTRYVPGGVMTITMHPQVIGRGHRMLMLESLIERFRENGAHFSRMDMAAEAFRSRDSANS